MSRWCKVYGLESYEVSDDGKIRRNKHEKSLNDDTHGYYKVDLYKNGKRITKRVNRLVAEAFIPNPNNLPEVNHKDGNKHNNSVDNLEWVTKSENMRHAYSTGLAKPSYSMRGKKNPNSGRKGKPIRIIETNEIFKSSLECEKKMGLNNSHINDCLRGRQKTHRGFHFEYI